MASRWVRDRRAQQQTEGLRDGRPSSPRALTGYLLVRGGVHQIAYARAIENLTGAELTKMFPTPRIPTDRIPEGTHWRASRPPTTLSPAACAASWPVTAARKSSRW